MNNNRQWIVDFKNVEKKLKKDIKKGLIDDDDIKSIKQWASQIEMHGPDFLAEQTYWADHELSGELQGYRSSSFSFAGRIIYKIKGKKLIVKVIKITADHNYKK